eukprot:9501961-Pyramimonas_sp.AAC.2
MQQPDSDLVGEYQFPHGRSDPRAYTAGARVRGYDADVKGYDVDVKGYYVDVKGYHVHVKGYHVDVKATRL